uniref:Uncharacterized protein n=1 Tax=Calcidiscus leptoporus TaxID=127549 RepID=A0A7S0J913_9EUKA
MLKPLNFQHTIFCFQSRWLLREKHHRGQLRGAAMKDSGCKGRKGASRGDSEDSGEGGGGNGDGGDGDGDGDDSDGGEGGGEGRGSEGGSGEGGDGRTAPTPRRLGSVSAHRVSPPCQSTLYRSASA